MHSRFKSVLLSRRSNILCVFYRSHETFFIRFPLNEVKILKFEGTRSYSNIHPSLIAFRAIYWKLSEITSTLAWNNSGFAS